MSLRQGALIVYPRSENDRVRFRLLDLRALVPLEDERGHPFAALEADGAVFVAADRSYFFIFPVGPDEPSWSGSAEAIWESLPERTYLEELAIEQAQEQFWRRAEHARRMEGTLALSLPGVLLPEEDSLIDDEEPPRARLVVTSPDGELTLMLGESAITRGVLLGRYPRCDGSRFGLLSHHSISRVHALVIQIGGKIYAVDVGSTNGVWLAKTRVLAAELGFGKSVTLAESVSVECSFLH